MRPLLRRAMCVRAQRTGSLDAGGQPLRNGGGASRMKKKRSTSRKSTKPPPARASRRRQEARAPALTRALRYKVVELSMVDEGSLERTFNEWTARGWSLDGVQFAMRESSKRPAMAFVSFTREAEVSRERPERGDERSGEAR